MIPKTMRNTIAAAGMAGEAAASTGAGACGAGQLNAGVLRNHVGNAQRHQVDGAVVVALLEQRNRLASKVADFAVRKDRLESIADLKTVFMVLDCQQNQNAAIC